MSLYGWRNAVRTGTRYRRAMVCVLLLPVSIVFFHQMITNTRVSSGTRRYELIIANNSGKATMSDEDPCFAYGTRFSAINGTCVCADNWYGETCAVPEPVWRSPHFRAWYSQGLIRRRVRPRTIINGFVINHEMDMLEIRVKELEEAVDYFLACESNYTFFGTSKPLYLSSNLSAGFLSEHKHKIITLTVGVYNAGNGNPWAPEDYLRSFIWKVGRHHFPNIRDDDLFLITDADEIPSRDVMLFMKHHDGFGEPVAVKLRSFIYGFFWESWPPCVIRGVCSVGYLRDVYQNDSLEVRRGRVNSYGLNIFGTGTMNFDWTISGIGPRFSGWHCSWCFNEVGIQVKLASAQKDDGVRWGDLVEKTDLIYIKSLRKSGKYFDNSTPATLVNSLSAAPSVLKKNLGRWRHLLFL